VGKSQGRNEVKEETDERLLSYRAVGHSASILCMIRSAKITASAIIEWQTLLPFFRLAKTCYNLESILHKKSD